MFEAVARIEVFLRSRLAYFAAKEDGAFGYPDSTRTKLSREYSAAKKSEQYIKHFANAYGDEHDSSLLDDGGVRHHGHARALVLEGFAEHEDRGSLGSWREGPRIQELAFRPSRHQERMLPSFPRLEQGVGRLPQNPERMELVRGCKRQNVRRPVGDLPSARKDRRCGRAMEGRTGESIRGLSGHRLGQGRCSKRLARYDPVVAIGMTPKRDILLDWRFCGIR